MAPRIRLADVHGPKGYLAVSIGTALGAGFFPWGPGTMGALVALPLAFWSHDWSIPAQLALWAGLTAAGTWAARVIDEQMRSGDNQSIVVDEVIGLGITAWTAGSSWTTLWAAFVLFRFFDIVKPYPVRAVDRWSKKKAEEPSATGPWFGAFGVMADDIVAGFQGLLVVLILQYFQLLP